MMIFFPKNERIKIKRYHFAPVFIVILFSCYGCSGNDYTIFSGNTMGTTYHIKIFSRSFNNISTLKKRIDQRLDEINQSMSTYIDESEISRFNRSGISGKKFYISDDFLNVMKVAETIYRITGGAWDGTIKPLVHLWGFDGSKKTGSVPEQESIEKTVSKTGFNNIEVSEKGVIITYVCTLTSSFTLKDVTLLIVANGAQLSADKIDIYIGTTTIEKQVTIPPNIIKQALYNSILLEIYLSKNNIKVPLKKITIGPILVNKIKVIKVNVDIFQMKVYAEILVPLNKTIVPENIILPLIILQRNAQGAVVSKTSLQIKPVNNVIKLEFKVALQTRAIEIILENPFNITLVKYGIGGE